MTLKSLYEAVENVTKKKSLYVSRKVTNPQDIREWFASQGLKTIVPDDQLHVTIIYSTQECDWENLGDSFDTVKVSGDSRSMESFDDGSALVLKIQNSDLDRRNKELQDRGAKHSYDLYQSHITISYNADGIDPASIKPFEGDIFLGPESFSEIKKKWASALKEVALNK